MESFLRGLSGYANKCRQDNLAMKNGTVISENRYKILQADVKKTLSEPKKKYEIHRTPIQRRKAKSALSHETFKDDNEENIQKERNRLVTTPKNECLPAPFPTYNYALPVQPIVRPKRFFKSTERIQ